MAGDTLRGIGKKQIAEALESPPESAPERTTEGDESVQTRDAAADIDIEEGRPVRSLDELPSDGTAAQIAAARPVDHNAVTMLGGLTGAPVPIAPDIAPDVGPELAPDVGPELARGIAPELAPDIPPELAAALGPVAASPTPVSADDAVPLGTTPSTRSGPNRVSFGTMIGHEMHAVQARVAAAIAEADSNARGTAHGRDVHLPASPGMAAANPEPVALAVPIASAGEAPAAITGTSPGSAAVAASLGRESFREGARESGTSGSHDALNEFSGGDHSFFETAPVNDEYEPENPRGRLYTRLAISGAVLAMVSVVVVAWVNSHGSSSEEPPPVEIKTAKAPAPRPVAPVAHPAVPPQAPAPAPAPVAAAPVRSDKGLKEPPPTSTIPSSMPEVIPPPPVAAPAPVRIANAAPAGAPSERKAPSIAPPPATRDERKPSAGSSSASASAAPARQEKDLKPDQKVQKPAVTAAVPAPAKPAAEPAAAARDKKPAAVAAKPAEAPHPAASHPREAARPAAPAPKVASSPAARAPRPETPARPVAKPAAPSAPRAQKGPPARGKNKYDPDGTLPLSFD